MAHLIVLVSLSLLIPMSCTFVFCLKVLRTISNKLIQKHSIIQQTIAHLLMIALIFLVLIIPQYQSFDKISDWFNQNIVQVVTLVQFWICGLGIGAVIFCIAHYIFHSFLYLYQKFLHSNN